MMKTEREKVVEIANSYAPLLSDPNLSETDIDALIEELRSLRMKIRAIDYGCTPGLRKYDADHLQKAGSGQTWPKRALGRYQELNSSYSGQIFQAVRLEKK